MPKKHRIPPVYEVPIVTEEEAVTRLPRFVPRLTPTPIPTPSIFDEPTYCIRINKDWAGHLIGVVYALNQPDTWTPDEIHDVEWARLEVVNWMARWISEDMCMICCDETNELLQTIIDNQLTQITQNTTIINNQITVIGNNETIIDNNLDQTINNYFNQYQTNVDNNLVQQTWNNMFYDGTPQSIAPTLGENFNSTGDDALCGAIQRYETEALYQITNKFNTTARNVGVSAAVLSAWLLALAPPVGAAVGLISAIVGGISAIALGDWNTSVSDPEGKRKVNCCMYDGLKDKPLTFENFKASVTDCSFDVGTNESNIAAAINGNNQYQDNYLAFLRMLNGTPGSAADCECGCEDDIELEDFAGTGCVITSMGNCIWRFTQATPTIIGSATVWYFSFRDIMSRCLFVENSSDPLYYTAGVSLDTTTVDCDGVETAHGIGGFAPGEMRSAHWQQGGDATVTYYKITLAP